MKICQVFIYYLFNAIGQEQRKEFLNFYLMKTKMKVLSGQASIRSCATKAKGQ